MSKIKDIYEKHKIVIKYLVFGVITTVVSFSAFYICLWVATEFFGALEHGKDSTRYLVANIVANIIKWCAGVLTAFITNKKWVFTHADDSKAGNYPFLYERLGPWKYLFKYFFRYGSTF